MKDFTDPKISNYCLSKSDMPSKICQEIKKYTEDNVDYAQMVVGELEGSLLGFLVSLIGAKRILEIGCFTGYSALAMAERLPDDGELITLDINETNTEIAQSFWNKSPHGKKIHLKLGQALEILPTLSGKFDLAFIDADKINYLNYVKHSLLCSFTINS